MGASEGRPPLSPPLRRNEPGNATISARPRATPTGETGPGWSTDPSGEKSAEGKPAPVWRIPPENRKGRAGKKRGLVVPLSPQARWTFEDLKRTSGDGDWFFSASPRANLSANFGRLGAALKKVTGVDFGFHDLPATCATGAEVQRLLGLESRWDLEAFLKQAGVVLDYDQADLARDLEAPSGSPACRESSLGHLAPQLPRPDRPDGSSPQGAHDREHPRRGPCRAGEQPRPVCDPGMDRATAAMVGPIWPWPLRLARLNDRDDLRRRRVGSPVGSRKELPVS